MVRSGLKIRPKYEAYFIRQPIEGGSLDFRALFASQKLFAVMHLRKRNSHISHHLRNGYTCILKMYGRKNQK